MPKRRSTQACLLAWEVLGLPEELLLDELLELAFPEEVLLELAFPEEPLLDELLEFALPELLLDKLLVLKDELATEAPALDLLGGAPPLELALVVPP